MNLETSSSVVDFSSDIPTTFASNEKSNAVSSTATSYIPTTFDADNAEPPILPTNDNDLLHQMPPLVSANSTSSDLV